MTSSPDDTFGFSVIRLAPELTACSRVPVSAIEDKAAKSRTAAVAGVVRVHSVEAACTLKNLAPIFRSYCRFCSSHLRAQQSANSFRILGDSESVCQIRTGKLARVRP